MKQTKKEQGAASIFVELNDGIISVYHGTDKTLLQEWEAEEGDWQSIWTTIRKLKLKADTINTSLTQ